MHAPSSSSKHKISTIRAFPRCPCVIFVSEYKMLKFQRHPETHALVTHFGHSAPFRSPYVRRYRASICALGLGKDGRCLKQRRQASHS